ncbi:hypothetical protein [Pseudoalteromonas luteoviolacea]|nr:hypothetical protein [Pseudoalteromonas luteoviolacea]
MKAFSYKDVIEVGEGIYAYGKVISNGVCEVLNVYNIYLVRGAL